MIRTPVGGGIRGGHYHSQSPEALFIHTPGLKVVCPSNPYDAKGLLLASIRDHDPVLFFEPKRIYRAAKGEVPEGDYTVPLGKAKVVREGTHVTVRRLGRDAATRRSRPPTQAAGAGHRGRGHRPAHAVAARHRHHRRERARRPAACVDRARGAARPAASAPSSSRSIHEKAFLSPRGAAVRVTGFDTPFPYTLENEYLPLAHRILPAIVETAQVLRRTRMALRVQAAGHRRRRRRGRDRRLAVKEGDAVNEDQPMVEVMTDKATVTITAPKRGHDRRDARQGGRHRPGARPCSSCSSSSRCGDGRARANGARSAAAHGSGDGKAPDEPAATAVGDIKETCPA